MNVDLIIDKKFQLFFWKRKGGEKERNRKTYERGKKNSLKLLKLFY